MERRRRLFAELNRSRGAGALVKATRRIVRSLGQTDRQTAGAIVVRINFAAVVQSRRAILSSIKLRRLNSRASARPTPPPQPQYSIIRRKVSAENYGREMTAAKIGSKITDFASVSEAE